MAPSKTKTKAPRRANNHERFLPPSANHISLEDSPSDAALQVSKSAPESQTQLDWEGFEEEEGNEEDEEGQQKEDVDMSIDQEEEEEEAEKDEEEEELEHLVFGDSAGFRKDIQSFSLDKSGAISDDESAGEGEGEDLDAVADQDLFFFDAGPVSVPAGAGANMKSEVDEDEEDQPAWEDSDDERLTISLASVPRLRKLRATEEDDVVSGKEYVRRLRKQYQRLYPTPEWASHATDKGKRKRRRTMEDGGSEEDSTSDMDVDAEDDLSTQPLARLLKDADIIARTSRGPVKRRKLQAGTVNIQRLKDVSKNGPSAITSLSFHSTYPLLLSSGPASTVYLHHVQPNPPDSNPLLTSLLIKRTPLTTTAFHPSSADSRIFLSARRRYFHVWNLATGAIEKISRVYGHQHEQRTMEYFSLSPNGMYMALRGSSKKGGGVINILDATTLQWTTQVRIESRGGVADFAWWGDGTGLSIAGKNGEITEYSIQDGVVGRWIDEGAVGTTVIAVGSKSGRDGWLGGDRWVAVGSSSGIVNVYDRRAWMGNLDSSKPDDSNNNIPRAPKPMKVLENLSTPISHLTFSPDGQILLMASRWKHNALRLVHLPSATVFKNWPTEHTSLGRISSVAWGRPQEEEEREGALALLAVGNETGKVRLWEIRA